MSDDDWAWYQAVKPRLGRADWRWDDEMQLHMPCCSTVKDNGQVCGNGPLVGDAIISGDCGESHITHLGAAMPPRPDRMRPMQRVEPSGPHPAQFRPHEEARRESWSDDRR